MDTKSVWDWIDSFEDKERDNLEVILAPSFVHVPLVTLKHAKLSCQDVSIFERGAHTGDVGLFQVKEYCQYAIVGHSERKEPKSVVLEKRDMCLAAEVTPIVCFTDPAQAVDYYKEGVILAWEDPENISVDGVFRPKDPKEVQEAAVLMRASLPEKAQVLYGGSVNRQNAPVLAKIRELDGVLVGGASLDALHFLDIIRTYEIYESEANQ